MEIIRAALFVPVGVELGRWLEPCAQFAEAQGWEVSSLARYWDDLHELMKHGLVDVGVVGRWDHLPPDRLPRLESPQDQQVPGSRRATRISPRRAGM